MTINRVKSLVWCMCAAFAACCLADAVREPADRTKVMLFFDTEDYTCDDSNDPIRDLANILTEEGVRGNFNIVGYLALRIAELGRKDVVDSLKPHVLGTQTLYHSRHPDIAELGDHPVYEQAYRNTMREEAKGVGMLESTFGEGRIIFACPPGNSVSAVAMDVYSDLGIPFNAGTGFYTSAMKKRKLYRNAMLTRNGPEVLGLWYFNQYHLPYYISFGLERLIPREGVDCPDFKKVLDDLAGFDFAALYMHPHMAIKKSHWDSANYRNANLSEWRKWRQVEKLPKEVTAEFYARLRAFIRAVKADSRFEFSDIERLNAELLPRRPITRADIPAIRASLLKDFNAIRSPGSWSVADAFQAAVRLLRGEKRYDPGKVYGFMSRPSGVKKATVLSAADLRAAAEKIDLSGFLPTEIRVGDEITGPADFLFAALEVLETGKDSVTVLPREQLGSFKEVPALPNMKISGSWVHTKAFKDEYLSERLRLQLWTLRFEEPDGEREKPQCRISPDTAEIVVGKDAAKPVSFADDELNFVLGRAFGTALPVVNRPTAGKVSIYLGDCSEARAAGIDVKSLQRDAFVVKVEPGRVFIAGRDDPLQDLAEDFVGKGRVSNGERATLFGVYDFLERHLGARFYFPGEIGTVIPKTTMLRVPAGTETRSPDFSVRSVYFHGDGPVPDETSEANRRSWKALSWLRLRMQTESVPCCHGQRGFSIPERFHKTHPEYFALLKQADNTFKRDIGAKQVSDCDVQLCQSSGLWDVLYEDCKAYLTGQPASSRGIVQRWKRPGNGWNVNCVGRFIDVMPQDGMPQCHCENCQSAYVKGSRNFATELVWGNTAKLARRLSADGLDCIITQMAYPPYRDVPKCDLPSNVWVMVAEMGPWGEACPGQPEREIAEIRRWAEKLGHKIWMWTYPSKFGKKATPGVPDMAPRAWAKYYKRTAPYSYGAFCESECEKSIFHYLNYYMFSRVAWDNDVDVEAVLDEHFRLMFGAAADEMSRFYSELEDKWTKETLFRWHNDRYGGKTFSVSSDVRLWRVVYSPEVRARWTSLFDEAEKKVACDADAFRRVRFIRREFLDYMKGFAERFEARADPERGRAHYRTLTPETNLIPMQTAPEHRVLTDFRRWSGVSHSLKGKIKPNTKYRVSALIKLKNCVPQGPHHNGCCYFACHAGGWNWFPSAQAAFCGTIDWTYCSYEFKTPKVLKTDEEDKVSVAFGRGTGELWVDCFSVEEVKGEK